MSRKQALQVHDRSVHFQMTDIDFMSTEQIIDETDLFEMLSGVTYGVGSEFFYSGTPYDKQGIVYMLATNNVGKEWENPYLKKKVDLTAYPETCLGQIEDVLLHKIGQWYPNSNEKSQVTIDFRPSNICICPTWYTMSYYEGGHGYLLRYWQLLGSNDGQNFEVIKDHVNDESFLEEKPTHTFQVQCSKSYSVFRLLITGKDTDGWYFLAVRYVFIISITFQWCRILWSCFLDCVNKLTKLKFEPLEKCNTTTGLKRQCFINSTKLQHL
jgi:hypothetical protein